MKIGRDTSILEVNRNMPKIISWSVKSGKAVDFMEALRYPYVHLHLVLPFQMKVNDQRSFFETDGNETIINELLLDYIIKLKTKVLNIVRCIKMYFSKYNHRQKYILIFR